MPNNKLLHTQHQNSKTSKLLHCNLKVQIKFLFVPVLINCYVLSKRGVVIEYMEVEKVNATNLH